ncbi:hypothetical protein R5R35_014037 [Gryllus longicercus]|uniref:Protein halfway n=1 Tax=Gryllus longicercus TaxID=2509291 RepID=A0AAN9VUE5_9ORTH|nr:Protein halfway [Gryllus bimaculatus]
MHQGHLTAAFLFILVSSINEVCGLEKCHYGCQETPCSKCGNDSLVYCNVKKFNFKETLGGMKNYTHLHLYNITIENMTLPADMYVKSLTITNGNIKHISFTGKFHEMKCLNLSNNGLNNVTIKNDSMPNLRILDISKNNLSYLPESDVMVDIKHNFTLDISGNNRIDCNNVKELIDKKKKSLEFRNRNITVCSALKDFHWFQSAVTISLSHLEDVLDRQCAETVGRHGCRCIIHRYIPRVNETILIALLVNCSNLQLKSLPSQLPPNTVALDVSNNNITSLEQMKDSSYSSISMFKASNNCISSIAVLEGTSFISNFSILDLRRNNLSSVPTYFLSNSFDRNMYSRVYLGGNKLICDCNTAQSLKIWLMLNKPYIQDYKEVGCRNIQKPVIELEQHEVCVTQRNWTDYIYYIIAGEVTLLIFLVSKVSYDYWVFKTAGYLPWPASKLPKLPCDWVFET